MTDHLFWFECPECGWDSLEARALAESPVGACPMCREDSGHVVEMRFRHASESELRRAAGIPVGGA